MTKAVKKKLLYFGLPALLIIVVVGISMRKPKPVYSTVAAEYGSLIQTVSETGTVKPVKELSLNFLIAGKIDTVNVKIGDKVLAGDVLASLDTNSLELKRQEAQAALSIAQANYSKTTVGASYEAINVAKKSLEQAQAAESAARLDLEKTKRTIEENIRQAEKTYSDLVDAIPSTMPTVRQAVISAQTSLENAEKTYTKTIENSKDSLLLALNEKLLTVRVAMSNVTKIFDDEDAKNVLSVKNFVYKAETENKKNALLEDIPEYETLLAKARSTEAEADILAASNYLSDLLYNASRVLDSAYLMLENSITSSDFTQTELDAYKSLMTSQSTTVNTAASSLSASSQAYRNALLNYDTGMAAAQSSLDQAKSNLASAILTAKNAVSSVKLASEQQHLAAVTRLDNASKAVSVAQAQYNSVVAPARSQDLELARAQVSQAEAALENINKSISDASLKAPIDGTITEVAFKAGEQYSGAMPMINMLVDNNFEIEVDISESNISKVKVGNEVDITFDAFPDDLVLKGLVHFIEPAQTLISGVVYYKVSIELEDLVATSAMLAEKGLALKAGMTANTVITTDSRENVISVPSRAIIEEGGRKIVRVLNDDEYTEIDVSTGLRGDNGMTEITGNIKAGDEIITFIKEPGK